MKSIDTRKILNHPAASLRNEEAGPCLSVPPLLESGAGGAQGATAAVIWAVLACAVGALTNPRAGVDNFDCGLCFGCFVGQTQNAFGLWLLLTRVVG